MRYVKSKYNYFHSDADGNILMCNFVRGSSSFLKVKKSDGKAFNALIEADELGDSDLEKHGFYRELVDKGYYIGENEDELFNIRTLYYESTMAPILSLTVMPTEKCNFRCRYCYEKFEKGRMTDEDQISLLKFIQKQIPGNAHVHISWFGGEPLLAFDVIENIMRNVSAMCKARG